MIKCSQCDYENPDDALNCSLCGAKLKDATASSSAQPSSNGPAPEQPVRIETQPSTADDIKNTMRDFKGYIIAGICVLLVVAFFYARAYATAQKYRDFENKIAEVSYPIYAALVTNKQPDPHLMAQVQSLAQEQASRCANMSQARELQAAIKRGQERARARIKRDFHVTCPYF